MATNTRFATGIHTLVLLAKEPDRLHSSESLAAKLHTNPVVIRRILAQLQAAGIVRNHKGPAGGSELLRHASKISLGDIYRVTDPDPLFAISAANGSPARKLTTELSKVQQTAQRALLRSLDDTSLESLARKASRK